MRVGRRKTSFALIHRGSSGMVVEYLATASKATKQSKVISRCNVSLYCSIYIDLSPYIGLSP